MLHTRAYLLSEAKRNDVLSLDEVMRYGSDSFGDPDYVSLYGLSPPEWYARGVRVLARTAVECTRDALARRIADDVAAAAGTAAVIVDPFAGSANTLYWLAQRLGARRAVGFELDTGVFAATRRNLSIVGCGAELALVDYESGLPALRLTDDEPLVVFLAPPWGDALSERDGLDLGRTQPPVGEIVDLIGHAFPKISVLVGVQVYERVLPASLDELRGRFAWSELTTYDINAPGQNHGMLLGRLSG